MEGISKSHYDCCAVRVGVLLVVPMHVTLVVLRRLRGIRLLIGQQVLPVPKAYASRRQESQPCRSPKKERVMLLSECSFTTLGKLRAATALVEDNMP